MTDQEIRDQILQNNARLVGNKIAAMAGAHSNIDSFYGPYKDVEQALLFTDKVKAVGLTVGIYKDENHNEITEYWYKKSTNTPSGWELVEKIADDTLSIEIPDGEEIATINGDGTFTLKYILKGKSIISSTGGQLLLNGLLVQNLNCLKYTENINIL